MPVDSTADLLFRIGANSDDAVENIVRFRALLGKNLGDLRGEFHEWASDVFGDLTTVKGAMIATGAGLAAAVVAAAGAAMEAAHKYSEFVDEVERGSRVTGLSAENMSRLKFAADVTHVSYDALVTGLTRFASSIVRAADGSKEQADAFHRIGISAAQLKAGEMDMLPLLEAVADRFHAMGSTVEKTAIARDLFSRGGPELVAMLSQGSAAMREMFGEAEQLGLVIGTKDVQANEEYKESLHLLKSEMEGMAVVVGRVVLPVLASAAAHIAGFIEAEREMAHTQAGLSDYLTLGIGTWVKAFALAGEKSDEFKAKMKDLAESLSKFGDGQGEGMGDVAKDAKEEWAGLTDVLRQVRDASVEETSAQARANKEFQRLWDELDKATRKYEELRAAGNLSAEDAKVQAAALAQMGAAFSALASHNWEVIEQSERKAEEELRAETLRQGQQTLAVKLELWAMEIAKRREKLEEEKNLNAKTLAELAALDKAGREGIAREESEAVQKAGDALNAKIAALGEQTVAAKKASLDREIAAMAAGILEKRRITDEEMLKLAEIRRLGYAKIEADAKAAGDSEIARLKEQQEKIDSEHQTHAQRIVAEYQAEAARYVASEEKKTLATAVGEAQRVQMVAMYAAIRKGLQDKEAADLQALLNSQGWQGVFGNKFAEMIRGNETLLKQWQTSTDQAALLVKVTLEGLREAGQHTFEQMAQGMGSNIASAIVYQKSIGDAMRSAVAATLESLASESITYAIYSTALGFLRLAQYDVAGADAAFTSAAIWGSVGAAAAVAGRFTAPGSKSGGGGSGAGDGLGPGSAENAAVGKDAQTGAVGATAAAGGSHVTVNVYGHVVGVSGVGDLCNMINDAVLNSDQPLTATNTTTGVVVRK